MAEGLKVGDIVKLGGVGPLLTIEDIQSDKALCT
jgi:uncharacterized protein YodC (DUF2158 family)